MRKPKELFPSNSPTYRSWHAMVTRCTKPDHDKFKYYGGRGITVCERWATSFQNFLDDMGPRPHGTTLDRKNNELGYSPENCRWATPAEQMRNTSRNMLVTIGGETMPLKDWCAVFGTHYKTAHRRIRVLGWNPVHAVSVKRRGKHGAAPDYCDSYIVRLTKEHARDLV